MAQAKGRRTPRLYYHLLRALDAKKDLIERQIKVSILRELNDPFEALSCALPTPQDRKRFSAIRTLINERWGLLCFSAGWHNPLLWSHYGERHKGICLGFSVPDNRLIEVQYTKYREVLTPVLLARSDIHELLLSRKYRDWAYEEEHRMLLPLRGLEKEGDLYFKPFGDDLKLREIIVGPMCEETDMGLRQLAPASTEGIPIIKSRMAFNTFRVVRNRKGFQARDVRRRAESLGIV